MNQALDARLVDEKNAKLLAKIKWIHSRIRFGCDTKGQIVECERAIQLIMNEGYSGEFFLYTMLHGTIEECYERINHWRTKTLDFRRTKEGCAVYPYAQPYRDPQAKITPPLWQRDMARWCNSRSLFVSTRFEDYKPRKSDTTMAERFGTLG